MSSEIRVTMEHVRRVHFCSRGARAFFQRYGLDWQAFLRDGIPASELDATGDALAVRVCQLAREEAGL